MSLNFFSFSLVEYCKSRKMGEKRGRKTWDEDETVRNKQSREVLFPIQAGKRRKPYLLIFFAEGIAVSTYSISIIQRYRLRLSKCHVRKHTSYF
mmetsp:Transcript_19280/g.49435  ORF Transcript_19280/g.49435 Transcript_19280/m.49435 type:complete len:94 (+) Transcript_19280:4390-4671(+)